MCKHETHACLKLISLRLTSQNFPCKHAFKLKRREIMPPKDADCIGTVKTLIRLLLEKSDLGVHCLP